MKVHLDDCSDLWEEYINEAVDSIVVFTPFFDEILLNLFQECDLPYSDITLITQLDWADSSDQNIRRLKLIVEMMNLGINVLRLNQLHAKMLFVDGERAIFGSQNFTYYSTGSYEISTEIEYDDDSEEMFETLNEWQGFATEVTAEDITSASNNRLILEDAEDEDEE